VTCSIPATNGGDRTKKIHIVIIEIFISFSSLGSLGAHRLADYTMKGRTELFADVGSRNFYNASAGINFNSNHGGTTKQYGVRSGRCLAGAIRCP
jgi:hypothetical protein